MGGSMSFDEIPAMSNEAQSPASDAEAELAAAMEMVALLRAKRRSPARAPLCESPLPSQGDGAVALPPPPPPAPIFFSSDARHDDGVEHGRQNVTPPLPPLAPLPSTCFDDNKLQRGSDKSSSCGDSRSSTPSRSGSCGSRSLSVHGAPRRAGPPPGADARVFRLLDDFPLADHQQYGVNGASCWNNRSRSASSTDFPSRQGGNASPGQPPKPSTPVLAPKCALLPFLSPPASAPMATTRLPPLPANAVSLARPPVHPVSPGTSSDSDSGSALDDGSTSTVPETSSVESPRQQQVALPLSEGWRAALGALTERYPYHNVHDVSNDKLATKDDAVTAMLATFMPLQTSETGETEPRPQRRQSGMRCAHHFDSMMSEWASLRVGGGSVSVVNQPPRSGRASTLAPASPSEHRPYLGSSPAAPADALHAAVRDAAINSAGSPSALAELPLALLSIDATSDSGFGGFSLSPAEHGGRGSSVSGAPELNGSASMMDCPPPQFAAASVATPLTKAAQQPPRSGNERAAQNVSASIDFCR